MALSYVISSNIAVTARKIINYVRLLLLGITYLKRKRKERRFADLQIILILKSGTEFLKHYLNLRFKLNDNVSRYGNSFTNCVHFLGTDSKFLNFSMVTTNRKAA